MGKHVIDAADGARLPRQPLQPPVRARGAAARRSSGSPTPEQVDRICRMAGGFRMGPFELMDLVGLDVGFAVSRVVLRAVLRRAALAAVAAGRAAGGRRPARPQDRRGLVRATRPAGRRPRAAGARRRRRARRDRGRGELAGRSRPRPRRGWDVAAPEEADGEVPALIVDCGDDDDSPLQGGPQLAAVRRRAARRAGPGRPEAGFHLLPPLGRLVELTAPPTTAPAALAAAERFFATLGMHAERVGDAPGLVLGRIVAQLVNEACFALGEGVGSRRRTSTPAWCSASTTRAGRWSGATRSAPTRCSALLDGAAGRVPRGALPPGAGARARRADRTQPLRRAG